MKLCKAAFVLTLSLTAAATAAGPRGGDLAGQWAVERVVRSTFDLPLLGLVEQVQTIRAIWTVARDAAKGYHITERLCGVRTTGSTNAVRAKLQPGFAAGASGTRFAATVDGERLQIQGVAMVGTRSGPDAPLPDSADHPDVRDIDKDGQPGFTVTIEGLVSGDVRYVRRERMRFDGRVAGDRMRGDLDIRIDQHLLSASTALLETPIPVTMKDARFRGARVSGKRCSKGAFKDLDG